RDSAREMLARRVEEQTPAPAAPPPRRTGRAERAEEDGPRRDPAPRRTRPEPSVLEQLSRNTLVRQLARTAGREILRGIFGTRRRR
ncbi:helicase HerA-like domain-containing protein, partial [Desertihabitans aurantiacus]|uniref:helicase HerA-like domain-containing protein n=1 Tax=Desertihabitans aurantiacus TaxID=2282477 RepID=UPI000DF84DF6